MKYDIVQRCFIMLEGQHIYEVRPRKDRRGVDLISDALPFGRLWYGEPNVSTPPPEGDWRSAQLCGLFLV